jgi:hypothetical protein
MSLELSCSENVNAIAEQNGQTAVALDDAAFAEAETVTNPKAALGVADHELIVAARIAIVVMT